MIDAHLVAAVADLHRPIVLQLHIFVVKRGTRNFGVGLDAIDAIKPELVLVSAGFDAHAADPVGSLGLEVEDFAEMTKRVLDVARTHAGERMVSCLEGGYDLEALAASVQAHLEELLGAAT